MYRYHLISLQRWFEQISHKPLMLRGARQVGKSTLVRLFAKKNHLELVELNFERNHEYADLFVSKDPKKILATIRLIKNQTLKPQQSLLFLDEIQATPQVLASLRYFYEELPQLHVIAAGSLLDFALASPTFSMPVGRMTYLNLHPMNFIEFLHAVGNQSLAQYLETWKIGDDLPIPLHQKLTERLRQCMAVGGMPEAVKNFSEAMDYRQCEQIKQDLLATFMDDFAKYAHHQDQELIGHVFRQVPTWIGCKVKYSKMSRGVPTPRIARAINQLRRARVVTKVIRTAANGFPLSAEENIKFFKLLFLDIGLVSTLLNVTWQTLQENLMLIHRGKTAEQWVGQELLTSQDHYPNHCLTPYLHYWAREARSSSAEVDYVLQTTQQPVPVKVKSGKSGSLKSLHLFLKEKASDLAVRFNTDVPSLTSVIQILPDGKKKPCQLLSLPLYMAGQVHRLLK